MSIQTIRDSHVAELGSVAMQITELTDRLRPLKQRHRDLRTVLATLDAVESDAKSQAAAAVLAATAQPASKEA